MRSDMHNVRVDQVDWLEVLPVLRLGRLFRSAIQPSKLLLGWLIVAGVWVLGELLAVLLAPGRAVLAESADLRPVDRSLWYDLWIERQLTWLSGVRDGALSLNFGLDTDSSNGIVPSVLNLAYGFYELVTTAPVFSLLFLLTALALAVVVGGGICRLMSREACLDKPAGLSEAAGFMARKLPWLLVAPLLPLLLIGSTLALLAGLGLMLFNLPVLDVLGTLLLGILFGLGFVAALSFLGFLIGVHLFPASLAVEGSDAYDAVSRSLAYVTAKPWQLLGYALFALAYGAATFTFMAVLAYLTFVLTRTGLDLGSFVGHTEGALDYPDRADAILPRGEAVVGYDASPLATRGFAGVAAWIATRWTQVLASIPMAYAVSFYFCATVWVYLLLRRSAEGSGFNDCDASRDSVGAAFETASGGERDATPEWESA